MCGGERGWCYGQLPVRGVWSNENVGKVVNGVIEWIWAVDLEINGLDCLFVACVQEVRHVACWISPFPFNIYLPNISISSISFVWLPRKYSKNGIRKTKRLLHLFQPFDSNGFGRIYAKSIFIKGNLRRILSLNYHLLSEYK